MVLLAERLRQLVRLSALSAYLIFSYPAIVDQARQSHPDCMIATGGYDFLGGRMSERGNLGNLK